jgi:hypothetical protein
MISPWGKAAERVRWTMVLHLFRTGHAFSDISRRRRVYVYARKNLSRSSLCDVFIAIRRVEYPVPTRPEYTAKLMESRLMEMLTSRRSII